MNVVLIIKIFFSVMQSKNLCECHTRFFILGIVLRVHCQVLIIDFTDQLEPPFLFFGLVINSVYQALIKIGNMI